MLSHTLFIAVTTADPMYSGDRAAHSSHIRYHSRLYSVALTAVAYLFDTILELVQSWSIDGPEESILLARCDANLLVALSTTKMLLGVARSPNTLVWKSNLVAEHDVVISMVWDYHPCKKGYEALVLWTNDRMADD